MSVVVQDLSFSYPPLKEGDTPPSILKNVNLTVTEGEFVVMVGPSGCGKSTLALVLLGLIPHNISGEMKGRVLLNGYDTRENSVAKLSEHAGLVFQNPDNQLFCLRVVDEVAFGLENRGVPKEDMRERVGKILTNIEISDLSERFVFALSGGQKQRVAIASNLAVAPSILILDEPTSDLDLAGTSEVLSTIQRLRHEKKMTILLIEHRLERIMDILMPDRVVVMHEGQIVLDKPPRELLRDHTDYLSSIGIEIPEAALISKSLTSLRGRNEEPVSAITFDEIRTLVQGLVRRQPDPKLKVSGQSD